MVSAPWVVSGAVALMSLSVKSNLADAMDANGKACVSPSLVRMRTCSSSMPWSIPGEILAALVRFGEHQPSLVARPIGIILQAGERPVDARRADLEAVAALDRVAASERLASERRREIRSQSVRSSWRVSGRSAMT